MARTIMLRATDGLEAEVILRAGETEGPARYGKMGPLVVQSLATYFDLLRHERAGLSKTFTAKEISVIVEALKDNDLTTVKKLNLLPQFIGTELVNAESGKKARLDVDALTEKLQTLSMTGRVALVDAANVFWRKKTNNESPDIREALNY